MTDTQYRVELFQESDAIHIPALFYETYGDGYSIPMIYHPEEIIAAYHASWYYPIVVKSSSDQVIGFGALCKSAPFQGMYEFVQGVVSPAYRGLGIGAMLFEFVSRYVTTLPGAEIYFGEAVCNHTKTQRLGDSIGSIATGIELDLISEKTYATDPTGTGRVSVLATFRTMVSRPHTVYVPVVYEGILHMIYQKFDDIREIFVSASPLPDDRQTRISHHLYPAVGVARIEVIASGSDFPYVFSELEQVIRDQQIGVIQVWIPLTWPWVGAVAEALREQGYFFGGLFPRWFNDDGLLMQKVMGKPNWDGIHLTSSWAETICQAVYDDWSAMQKPGGNPGMRA